MLDHCYKWNSEEITWEAARAKCVADGGDLASVLSWGEQDFIKSKI